MIAATENSIAITFNHVYGDRLDLAVEAMKQSRLAADLFIYSDDDDDYGFDTVAIQGYYYGVSYVSVSKSVITITKTIGGSSNEVAVYEVTKV